MVIRPRQRFAAHLLADSFWDLGPKTQMMNDMREDMTAWDWGIEVVVQVVNVHISVTETASGGNVEVTHDLVDSNAAFNSASLFSLRVQPFAVVLALALLDVLASSKGPRY